MPDRYDEESINSKRLSPSDQEPRENKERDDSGEVNPDDAGIDVDDVLNSAIGEAFKQFYFQEGERKQHSPQENDDLEESRNVEDTTFSADPAVSVSISHEQESKGLDENSTEMFEKDDRAIEDVIGDALKTFEGGIFHDNLNIENRPEEEEPREKDSSLSTHGSKAEKSVYEEETSQDFDKNHNRKDNSAAQGEPEYKATQHEHENEHTSSLSEEIQLSRAISSALSELAEPAFLHKEDISEQIPSSISSSQSSSEASDSKIKNDANESISESQEAHSKSYEDDFNIATAINDAINGALKNDQRNTHGDSQEPYDLSNVAESVISQLIKQDDHVSKSSQAISDDILRELAMDITSQVHDNNYNPKGKYVSVPEIDESVLDHFQKEAHKDDKDQDDESQRANVELKYDDSALQTALVSAVKNAIDSANFGQLSGEKDTRMLTDSRDSDFDTESSQMTELLQNAFNFAMSKSGQSGAKGNNENEELQQFESESNTSALKNQISQSIDDNLAYTTSSQNILDSYGNKADLLKKGVDAVDYKERDIRNSSIFSDRLTNAKNILSALSSKNMAANLTGSDNKKPLSIAETLALHRTSMLKNSILNNRTDDKALNPAITNNISSILSSLVKKDNVGVPKESKVLDAIRSIVDTYGSGPSLPATSATGIIKSYKDAKMERALIEPLVLAKAFLSVRYESSNESAAILIDGLLNLFSSEDPENEPNIDFENPIKLEFLSMDLINSLIPSISSAINTYSSRPRKAFSQQGEKLPIDSEEYKERIRSENRQRKKRWREENSERNKDNDLRSRVIKRANTIFGEGMPPEKKIWIEEEFNKRREKRIAKQKRDESERKGKELESLEGVEKKESKDKELNSFSQDPSLIKLIRDLFTVVSDFTSKEGTEAALIATSTSTAIGAAIYTFERKIKNNKLIHSAVSSIIISILEHPTEPRERSGTISMLSDNILRKEEAIGDMYNSNDENKSSNLFFDSKQKSTGVFERITSLIRKNSQSSFNGLFSNSLLNSLSRYQLLNNSSNIESKKRTAEEIYKNVKRLTHGATGFQATPEAFDSKTSSTSVQDKIKDSSSESSIMLKIPQYGKPVNSLASEEVKDINIKYEPKLSREPVTPFLSNKIGNGTASHDLGIGYPAQGLRKPGSFQRPSFFKNKSKLSINSPGGH